MLSSTLRKCYPLHGATSMYHHVIICARSYDAFCSSITNNERMQQTQSLRKTNVRFHQTNSNTNPRNINITFKTQKNDLITVKAAKGENLLQIAHRNVDNGIEMEGACEGVCACSTCHVILDDDIYDQLMEKGEGYEPSEDEEDMLDMAFGLTTTSRLGCQVEISEDMEGAVFQLPTATRNFYVDGHVPKPH